MAGVELGTAYLSLVAETKGLAPSVRKAMGGVEKEAENSGRRSGFGWAKTAGKVLGGAAVAGAGLLAGTAITKGFNRALQLQDAEAKLSGLGHSGKGVAKIMENALGAVKGTAFGMGEAATVAASLVAANVKPGKELEGTLRLVGDAATIAGTDMTSMGAIFGKVAASNKVQMDSINQLHDAGVPALSLLADELGVTAEEASKMASKGEIDFATFQRAMEAGLGGAALKSGETFRGSLANMGAALGRLGVAFANPIVEHAPKLFTAITGAIDSLGESEAFQTVSKKFSDWLVPVLEGAADLISKVDFDKMFSSMKSGLGPLTQLAAAFSPIGVILKAMAPVMPQIGDSLARIGASIGDVLAKVLPAVADAFARVGAALAGALSKALPSLVPLFDALAVVLPRLAPALTLLVGLVATLTVAALELVTPLLDNEKVVAALVIGFIAWKGTILASKAAMVGMAVATKTWTAITKAAAIAQRALNLVMRANPIGLLITAIGLVVGALVWFFTKTKVGKKIIEVAWNGIKKAIKSVSDWWTKTAWPAIKKVIVALYVAFQLAKKKIGDAWEGIRKFFADAPGKIKRAFGAGWNFLTDKLKAIIGSYNGGTGLMGRVRNVVEFYKGLGGRLSRAAGALWSFLTDKIKTAIGSYSSGGGGVKGMLWKIVNFIKSTLPNKIKAAAKNIWSGLIGNALDVVGGVMKLVGKIPGVNGEITLSAAGVTKTYKYAQGGVLPGYTPGRDVHEFYSPTAGRLSLSGGEAIMRPEFTRAVGGAAGVAALNAKARRGEAFADGGIWGMEKFRAPDVLPSAIKSIVNATLGKLTVPSLLNAIGDKVFGYFLGGSDPRVVPAGGGKGGSGLRGNLSAMEAAAKALDPTVRVTSGYRPGATTVTGYKSYHGQGRAIDMVSSNMGALWDKLYLAYGKSAPELFFSGRSFSRFGKKGAPRSDHWDHVHWAMANGGILPKLYDQGGWLPTGTSLVQNDTGRPEPVFTGDQFDQMMSNGSPLVGNLIVQNEHEAIQELERLKKRRMTSARLTGARR